MVLGSGKLIEFSLVLAIVKLDNLQWLLTLLFNRESSSNKIIMLKKEKEEILYHF